jgi:hypothetical protein
MAVALKSPEEAARMRVAGRLAAEVLDYVAPHVKPGVTTGELNDLCHRHMVEVQGTTPAPLNYAPTNVGMPMPRFTQKPSRSSRATLSAICFLVCAMGHLNRRAWYAFSMRFSKRPWMSRST